MSEPGRNVRARQDNRRKRRKRRKNHMIPKGLFLITAISLICFFMVKTAAPPSSDDLGLPAETEETAVSKSDRSHVVL